MTTTIEHEQHADGCLMCAVRALTEGDPAATWTPTTEGATISGVVLRMGTIFSEFAAIGGGQIPFVDLWTGGTGRVRIKAYSASLRHAIDGVAPQIGDRLAVWFDGEAVIESGRFEGRPYKRFSANVQRGH